MRGSPEDEGRERRTGSRREGHSFGGVLIDSIGENSFFEMLIEEEAVASLSWATFTPASDSQVCIGKIE